MGVATWASAMGVNHENIEYWTTKIVGNPPGQGRAVKGQFRFFQ
jgi:hypothetical protein